MANDNSKNKPDVHVFIQGDADNAPLIKVCLLYTSDAADDLTR